MDYYKIGQRIRKLRKAHNLSQEELAEQISISVTHMSHIETGNTKLSLPVFVDIAQALQVRTDDLLYDSPTKLSADLSELAQLLEGCTPKQIRIIVDLARAIKISLEKHQ